MTGKPAIPPSLAAAFERSEHPFRMWEELRSLPEALERLEEAEPAASAALARARALLSGARALHLVGCGTSLFAGEAAEGWLEAATGLPARARDAFEFAAYPPAALEGSAVIAVSHTGTTASVLEAVRLARRRGARTLAVTDVVDSPLAREAEAALPWAGGPERALPKTRSYVTTLVRLRRLAAALAPALPAPPPPGELGRRARRLLEEAEAPAADLARQMAPGLARGAARLLLVGAGPHLATVQEGALKLQETSQLPALAFELEEVMHGPWTLLGEGDLLVLVEAGGPAHAKALDLARALRPLGARLWWIGAPEPGEAEAAGAALVTPLPAGPEADGPLLAVLPLYLFAYRLALALGRRPDAMRLTDPRYLEARLRLPR